jgi:hypothetical protein
MNEVRRAGTWGESVPSSSGAVGNGASGALNGGYQRPRAEALRGICFCLLYDVCCWLASVHRPVAEDVDEYALTAFRQVGDPRQRLSRYVSPVLLQSWEQALQPFFASGATLEPELGESGSFKDLGEDAGGRLQAELRFGNRSTMVDRDGRRSQLPPHEWILTVWLSPRLGGYVENATLRRA